MKHALLLLAAALLLAPLAGCGQDRSALATTTVNTYWNDVTHGKWKQAYNMLTPGVQSQVTLDDYARNWVEFLTKTAASLTVKVNSVHVKGDCADIYVTLSSVRAFHHDKQVHESLYWSNSTWKVSSENGAFEPVTAQRCP